MKDSFHHHCSPLFFGSERRGLLVLQFFVLVAVNCVFIICTSLAVEPHDNYLTSSFSLLLSFHDIGFSKACSTLSTSPPPPPNAPVEKRSHRSTSFSIDANSHPPVMSFVLSGLSRSERLLPVESEDTVRSCGLYRVRVIEPAGDDAKLYEHISFHWGQGRKAKEPSQRLARGIGSVKTAPRGVPFPAVSHHQRRCPPSPTHPQTPLQSAGEGEKMREENATPHDGGEGDDGGSSGSSDAPRLTLLHQWVGLLAPYETLLCSTLLCSPLLTPLWPDMSSTATCAAGFGEGLHTDETALPEASEQASAGAFRRAHSRRQCPSRLRHTLREVTKTAAEFSVPAQEALLFVSLCLVYLDVVVPSSSEAVTQHGEGTKKGEEEEKGKEMGDRALPANPPSSFADLADAVRRCVAHWTAIATNTTDRASQGATAGSTAFPTTTSASSFSSAAPSKSNAALALLQMAATEWTERRAGTVSNVDALGCFATAIAPRDLTVAGGGNDNEIFDPFEARATPREAHSFHLSPLPPDPLVDYFVPVWQSVLRSCLTDRQRLPVLREVLLLEAGKRCQELVRCASPTAPCPGPPSSSSSSPAASVMNPSPGSTSFAVYGPCEGGEWRWNAAIAWRGFDGRLLRCGVWPSTSLPHLPLTKPFVDVGLTMPATDLKVSVEELADYLCRLGALLPRLATNLSAHVVVLNRGQAQYVTKVLQRELFDVYLACKKHGIQELHLCAGFKGLALTFVKEDGREMRIGSPGQLSSAAYATTTATRDANTTLQTVAQGGFDDAVALVTYLHHRAGNTCRNLPLRPERGTDESGRGAVSTSRPKQPLPLPTVRVIVLRRAEESVLLRILQCHPHACYVIGCGIQQLVLRQSDGQPLVQRRCGVVVEWHLRDCYVSEGKQRLRTPKRIVPAVGRPLPLPPTVTSASRTSLAQVQKMMWHYFQALEIEQTEQPPTPAENAVSAPPSSGEDGGEARQTVASLAPSPRYSSSRQRGGGESFEPRTTLFPVDRDVALYVLRHHPHYYTHLRGCGVAEVYVAAEKRDERADTSAAATAGSHNAAPLTAAGRKSEPTVGSGEPPVKSGDDAIGIADGTADTVTAPTSASAATSVQTAAPAGTPAITGNRVRPTFVLQRICGRLVRFDVKDCYESTAPYALRDRPILVDGEEGPDASLAVAVDDSEAYSGAGAKRGRPW